MTSLSSEQRRVRLRRLHSVTGVLPLGAFLVLHLWVNAWAMQGERRYDAVVHRIQSIPGLVVLEVLGIALPLAFHAGYGVWTIRAGGLPGSPLDAPWAAPLKRATGLATLAFLAFHLASLRLRLALGTLHTADLYATLTDTLGTTVSLGIPLFAVLYLAGLAAASYHLASGLMGFSFTWDLARTERRHRAARLASTAIGLSLFLLGARTIVYFATGAAFPSFGSSPPPSGAPY